MATATEPRENPRGGHRRNDLITFAKGQIWEFVSAVDGSVRTYRLRDLEDPTDKSPLVWLRNVDTDKDAVVYQVWLREGMSAARSYWRLAEEQ